ncbi:MAG: HIT family protein [Acidobacteria bacterium]|nr:HIT family protein [Acidobacteriota bacterium]
MTSASCTFCKIVSGEHAAPVVLEDQQVLAFLDHRPLFPGHCLLVPKVHCETLSDLPQELVEPVFSATQLLSRAVEEALRADGVFVAINNRVSQSVPHLHVHIVPRRRKDGLKGFFWPRQNYKDEKTRAAVCEAIRQAVEGLR